MGLSILWAPVREGFTLEDTGAASDTMQRLVDTFGEAPIELGHGHAFALRAMTKASGCGAYENLADIIDKHGAITVWGEH